PGRSLQPGWGGGGLHQSDWIQSREQRRRHDQPRLLRHAGAPLLLRCETPAVICRDKEAGGRGACTTASLFPATQWIVRLQCQQVLTSFRLEKPFLRKRPDRTVDP